MTDGRSAARTSAVLAATMAMAMAMAMATPAAAQVDTVSAPAGFFAPGAGDVLDRPYYRFGDQDWGWTHGAIGTAFASASLYISAYDVDWTEIDHIYAMDSGSWTLLGALAETGNTAFSYTGFSLGEQFFDDIATGLKVRVDIDAGKRGWALTLGKSVVAVDGKRPGSAVPGVPEPSTWAMMIVGVGACGAALRRRRALRQRVTMTPDV